MSNQQTIELDDFTTAYLQAALWTSTDDNDTPLDRDHDISDIAAESIERAIADCAKFQAEHAGDLEETGAERTGEWSVAAKHGHDFWFTRNRHGVGFWDRDYGAVGDRLTEAAHGYGEIWVTLGDDGFIYIE